MPACSSGRLDQDALEVSDCETRPTSSADEGQVPGRCFQQLPFKKRPRQEPGAASRHLSLSAMTATRNCTSRMLVPRVDVGQRAVPPYGRKRISLFLSAAPCSTRRLWSAAELQAQGMGKTVHGQSDSVRPPSDHAQVCLALALSLSNRGSEPRKRPRRPPSENLVPGLWRESTREGHPEAPEAHRGQS